MERECKAVPYGVEYLCEVCTKGTMVQSGLPAYLTYPPFYRHKCTNPECGAERNLTGQYPTVRWRMESTAEDREPEVQRATLRVGDSEMIDIECRFDDGQKLVAVMVDEAFPELAARILAFLNGGKP